jgi:hypothetical protein
MNNIALGVSISYPIVRWKDKKHSYLQEIRGDYIRIALFSPLGQDLLFCVQAPDDLVRLYLGESEIYNAFVA